MRHLLVVRVFSFLLVVSPGVAGAQSTQDQSASIPRLITITGVYRPADGKAPGTVETLTLSIYTDQQGGAPLFQETQQVTLDDRGRYSVVLGAAHADGIPPAIFSAGGQWLGTVFERPGEVEGPRARLTSVPYAMRAAEADTLGGHPASDYVLANSGTGEGKTATAATRSDVAAPAGTANFIPKYVDTVNLGDSALYDSGGMVGLGTTTPFDVFHVRYTNTGGNLTGFAVQNLGNTANSYSGMLFYDQNGALGQFQGFNNVTHEYRINNIARNGGGTADGSINFMIGGQSKFFVNSVGGVGIGTTTPSGWLEVTNPIGPTLVATTTYSSISPALGALISGRRSRGTPAAPTATLSGDTILSLLASGYGATNFGPSTADISMRAAENFTDTAQGTLINFSTAATGTTSPILRMTIGASGNVGVGTSAPASLLDVSNALSGAAFSQVTGTTFANSGGASLFVGSKARGTPGAPAAVQNGDGLVGVLGRGFFVGATSGFSGTRGGMFVRASENWTDTAQGTSITSTPPPTARSRRPHG